MRESTRIPAGMLVVVALLFAASLTPAQFSLTTTFASNNGQSGNQFDVVGINTCTITSMDVNIDPGSLDMEVWVVTGGGSKVGLENNAAAWTLVGSATGVVSNGTNVATPLPIALSINIPGGLSQGIYVTVTNGTGINYTNGVTPQGVLVSDPNMQILEGTGHSYPFASLFNPRNWNGTLYYNTGPALSDDLSLTGVPTPVSSTSCIALSNAETVTADYINLGSNTIFALTPIPMTCTIDDGVNPVITINEVFTPAADILQFDSGTYTFATTADLSVVGSYTITVTAAMVGDLDPSNDSSSSVVLSGGAGPVALPWTENFDAMANGATLPPEWTNDPNDATGTGSDWTIDDNGTPSGNTGPSGDHTTGTTKYVYVEDSGGNHLAVNMLTPCIDLAGTTNPMLDFWLHSNDAQAGTQQNFLSVDIMDPATGAPIATDALGPLGHIGNVWTNISLNLSPYIGMLIRIQFRVDSTNSGANSFTHDIAIDDVHVANVVAGAGQPPVPGLAELDVNSSRDANGFLVSSGMNGPYFTDITSGVDGIDITVSGAANQAILLLAGPLSVGSFVTPGMGQFDIGVATGGVPSGINIIADGSSSGLLNAFFNTGGTGTTTISFGAVPLPLGVFGTFQAVVYTGGPSVIQLSNAVQMTFI